MNDDELDLWLTIHNEQFDAQIDARTNAELRRRQVRSASASAPRGDESDLAEADAIWSGHAEPTGRRSRRRRVPSVRGGVRSMTRPASVRPTRRSFAQMRPTAVILVVVLCLLVASTVVGEFVGQRPAAPLSRERGESMVIGVPTDISGLGMMQGTYRYGFAYDLANWLSDDRHYTPTFYGFSVLEGLPSNDHREMLHSGEMDMMFTPNSVPDERGTEVSFAGPYMVTRGAVLVRADNTEIRTVDDLDGKRVCTWRESTYKEQSMRLGGSVPVEMDVVASCVDALIAGSVDAVAGDHILLAEIAKVEEANGLSVVPRLNFGDQQRYGVELEYDDVNECDEVRDAIRRFIKSGGWDRVFRANMPDVPPASFKPDPDRLDRCE